MYYIFQREKQRERESERERVLMNVDASCCHLANESRSSPQLLPQGPEVLAVDVERKYAFNPYSSKLICCQVGVGLCVTSSVHAEASLVKNDFCACRTCY